MSMIHHQDIIAILNNTSSEDSLRARYRWAKTALDQFGESPDFLRTLKTQLFNLNQQGLNRFLEHFSLASPNVPANPITQAFNHLKEQIRLRIRASDVKNAQQPTEKRLLLRTLIAAIELKNEPAQVEAFNDLSFCQAEASQYKFLHSLAAILYKFLAFFIPSLRNRAQASTARAKLPSALNDFRKNLEQPNQEYAYPGQLQEADGSVSCTSVALATSTYLGRMNNADIQAMVLGLSRKRDKKTLARHFGRQVQIGIALNRAVSNDEEDILSEKTLQTVEARLQGLNSEQFDEIKSLCTRKITTEEQRKNEPALHRINTAALDLRPHSNYQPEAKPDEQTSTLDKIITQAETDRNNVVFVATASNFATNGGHTISFFSRQVGAQRIYGIADSYHPSASSIRGNLRLFNNPVTFKNNLLSNFSQEGGHDYVNINAYDVSREPRA